MYNTFIDSSPLQPNFIFILIVDIWECRGTLDIHFRNWIEEVEPDGGALENCVAMTRQLSWYDGTCSDYKPAVCKQPVPPRWQ